MEKRENETKKNDITNVSQEKKTVVIGMINLISFLVMVGIFFWKKYKPIKNEILCWVIFGIAVAAVVVLHVLKKKAKVAQLVLAPVIEAEIREVDELSDTNRGANGYGSTGTMTDSKFVEYKYETEDGDVDADDNTFSSLSIDSTGFYITQRFLRFYEMVIKME